MREEYEIMVIGGGTSGLKAALEEAEKRKTVLIEPCSLGGTCLNNGCIPTKAMLESSHKFRDSHSLEEFGIEARGIKADFKRIMKRVRGFIQEGQSHIIQSTKKNNLTIIKENASFINENTVKAGQHLISARQIIISTGAKNVIPPIKGLDKVKYITNEEIVSMKKLPKSVIMIGGGYISMELATFFNELGSKVTVIEKHHHVLGMLDEDVSELIAEYYRKEGIHFQLGANIIEARKGKGFKEIIINDVKNPYSKKISVKAEEIVLAVGRCPNIKNLNLNAAGVQTDERGCIIVNEYLQTSNDSIYAMGDCTGKVMFAHSAKREEKIIINNFSHRKRMKFDARFVPWAVFTNPPISGVGLSEKEAREKFDVGILKAKFSQTGRAHIMGDTRGFVKVIYNKRNKHILGTVIIGPRADDLIHEFTILLNSSSPTVDTLRKTIHVHPTISEVMETLKEE